MRRILVVAILAMVGLTVAPSARAVDPPNTPPQGLQACPMASTAVSPACLRGALRDFDRARAVEGLGPMTLPRDFARLSGPAQLLVLTNLDRVDRGLAPVAGVASRLQPWAQFGAQQSQDPAFPSWAREGGANWASTASPLWSHFLWMYDDGAASPNVECGSGSPGACYGHRHNILHAWRPSLLMGAATDPSGGAAEIFLGADRHDVADVVTWAQQVRQIPVGVSTRHLRGPGALLVWASGRSMRVRVHLSGGWRASRTRLRLAAGHAQRLRVSGAGRGILTLLGPNGRVRVQLGA